ncbi:MAG: hypothetical protein ACLTDV_15450 [Eubacterium sp.]
MWQEPFFTSCANTVMVHIRRLRLKIEKKSAKTNTDTDRLGKGISFWIIRDIHLIKKVNTFIITK